MNAPESVMKKMNKQKKIIIPPSWTEPFSQMRAQVQNRVVTFWGQRNKREQTMLSVAAVVVTVALIYLVLLAPAWEGRQRLQKSLPTLRQQAAELQQIIAQTGNLNQTNTPAFVAISQSGVETVLKQLGIASKNIVVTGDNAKLQFSTISFSGLSHFLQQVQTTERWQVTEAKISAVGEAQSGIVDATITLHQKKNEG